MNYSLIVIDMQEDFFKRSEVLNNKRQMLVSKINELIGYCRKAKIPIIWVRLEIKEDLSDAALEEKKKNMFIYIKGTEGCKLLSELDYQPEDIEVIKKRCSAFYRTNLESIIEEKSINNIIVAGINTHACVRMAVVDAYQRDIEVILAKECIASHDNSLHEDTLRYITRYMCRPLSNKEINEELKTNK